MNTLAFNPNCMRRLLLLSVFSWPVLLGMGGCDEKTDEDVCGGLVGASCGTDEFCDYEPEDACGAGDVQGLCRDRPETCPEYYAPVCGCDGTTYGNDCQAHAAGVAVQAEGECGGVGAVCGGVDGSACAAEQFCNIASGCGVAGETGTCTLRPAACDAIYAPVCGCDGMNYGNRCEAEIAGVSVQREWECSVVGEACGGLIGLTCAVGQYCAYPVTAACGAFDQSGTCQPVPDACDDVFTPVCGCDGVDYSNAREAARVGVSVADEGQCGGFGNGRYTKSFGPVDEPAVDFFVGVGPSCDTDVVGVPVLRFFAYPADFSQLTVGASWMVSDQAPRGLTVSHHPKGIGGSSSVAAGGSIRIEAVDPGSVRVHYTVDLGGGAPREGTATLSRCESTSSRLW